MSAQNTKDGADKIVTSLQELTNSLGNDDKIKDEDDNNNRDELDLTNEIKNVYDGDQGTVS